MNQRGTIHSPLSPLRWGTTLLTRSLFTSIVEMTSSLRCLSQLEMSEIKGLVGLFGLAFGFVETLSGFWLAMLWFANQVSGYSFFFLFHTSWFKFEFSCFVCFLLIDIVFYESCHAGHDHHYVKISMSILANFNLLIEVGKISKKLQIVFKLKERSG